MATATEFNPYIDYRFAVRLEPLGEPLNGVSGVDINSVSAHDGPGWLTLTMMVSPAFFALLKQEKIEMACVSFYTAQDELDKPSLNALFKNVYPGGAQLADLKLDATEASPVTAKLKMRYESLQFVRGNSPLNYLAIAAED